MAIFCINCKGAKIKEVVKENHLFFFCETCQKLYDRAIDTQFGKDVLVNTDKGIYHISSGGAIKKGDKYLLIKRRTYPFGYDFPGGHIEYNEEPYAALEREILEETGLHVKNAQLVFSEEVNSKCRYGVDKHLQYFYICDVDEGTPVMNPESEGIGWYTLEEMAQLPLVTGAKFLVTNALKP